MPIPIRGGLDAKNHLDDPEATDEQIQAVIDFSQTKEWKAEMKEWIKMVDG